MEKGMTPGILQKGFQRKSTPAKQDSASTAQFYQRAEKKNCAVFPEKKKFGKAKAS